jgi:isocitrate/isopropylmalate dehydrogenase
MLEFLGESATARTIERAVVEVLTEQKVITRDLGGTSTTQEVADAVAARIRG